MVSDTASLTSFGVNTLVVQGSGQCAVGEFVGAVLEGTLLGFGGGGASDFPIKFSPNPPNSVS
jgi:hypothetical protein